MRGALALAKCLVPLPESRPDRRGGARFSAAFSLGTMPGPDSSRPRAGRLERSRRAASGRGCSFEHLALRVTSVVCSGHGTRPDLELNTLYACRDPDALTGPGQRRRPSRSQADPVDRDFADNCPLLPQPIGDLMRVILMEFNELSPVAHGEVHRRGEAAELPAPAERVTGHDHRGRCANRRTSSPGSNGSPSTPGSPTTEHGIEHLGDGHKLERKKHLGPALRRREDGLGVRLDEHHYEPPINGWVLPDPWVTQGRARSRQRSCSPTTDSSPRTSRSTRASDVPLSRKEQVDFLGFMARHGLPPVDRRRDRRPARRRAEIGNRAGSEP